LLALAAPIDGLLVNANETYLFEWILTFGPTCGLAMISDVDLLRPTIDVDVAGEYLATRE